MTLDQRLPSDLSRELQEAIGEAIGGPPEHINFKEQLLEAVEGIEDIACSVFVGYSQWLQNKMQTLLLISANFKSGSVFLTVYTFEQFATDCRRCKSKNTATDVRQRFTRGVTVEEIADTIHSHKAELYLPRKVHALQSVWETKDQICVTLGDLGYDSVVVCCNRGVGCCQKDVRVIDCLELHNLCDDVMLVLEDNFWSTFGEDLREIERVFRDCSRRGLSWDDLEDIIQKSRGSHDICRLVVEGMNAWSSAPDVLD